MYFEINYQFIIQENKIEEDSSWRNEENSLWQSFIGRNFFQFELKAYSE